MRKLRPFSRKWDIASLVNNYQFEAGKLRQMPFQLPFFASFDHHWYFQLHLSEAWPNVFTLHALGFIGGSAMSGSTLWAILGPIIAVAGIVLVVVGLRRGPKR